jgi:DNA polymerase-1
VKPTANTKEAYCFFHEGTLAFSRMEANGFRIDTKYLKGAMKRASRKIKEKENALRDTKVYKRWKRRFGHDLNLESTHQMSAVLFKEMGYKPDTFTESTKDLEDEELRKPKVDEYACRNIDDPFIKDYFAIKKLRKIKGTYLKGILRETVKGYLHTSFNLAGGMDDEQKGGAGSYRSSSSNPNLHNIPKRNKVMEEWIRQCFIPRPGRRLVQRDFSGVEVRVACCYTKDKQLIKEFTGPGGNPHGQTAQELFYLDDDLYKKHSDYFKKTVRDAAKNMFVFPQFYGSVYFQCAPPIWEAMERRDFRIGEKGITLREHLRKHGIKKLGDCDPNGDPGPGTFVHRVREVEQSFWNDRFSTYTQWKKDYYNEYLRRGYFDLYTGFRCKGYYRRNQVINFPIQGAAFHCLLWGLIEIQKEIDRRGMKTLLVSQIHDSLIADVPDDELQEYLDLSKEITEVKLREAWKWIIVPIETEVDVTPIDRSWFEEQEYVRDKESGKWILKA